MNRSLLLLVAGLLLLTGPSAAAPVISAAIGDPVPLAGYAPGADVVYLFLTGPNLPANGVRLDDIAAPVTSGDPSSFTRSSVDDSRWEYTWYTRTKGGTPDAGTYTVFIVTSPVGRRDLAGAEYATIMISLGSPGLVLLPDEGVTIGASPADSIMEGVTPGTTGIGFPGILQDDQLPDMPKGSALESNNTMNVTGMDNTPSPSVAASPLQNHSLPIPFPILAVLAAWGSVIAWMGTKKKT